MVILSFFLTLCISPDWGAVFLLFIILFLLFNSRAQFGHQSGFGMSGDAQVTLVIVPFNLICCFQRSCYSLQKTALQSAAALRSHCMLRNTFFFAFRNQSASHIESVKPGVQVLMKSPSVVWCTEANCSMIYLRCRHRNSMEVIKFLWLSLMFFYFFCIAFLWLEICWYKLWEHMELFI